MIELTSILGNSQKLDGGAMFGNAPRALWSRWFEPDSENRITLACRALLATGIQGQSVLFETGIGTFFEPRLKQRYGVVESEPILLHSLAAAGFTHEAIDVVVLSHLHFDHVGGLLAPWKKGQALQLLFPKATFLVSAQAWARAKDPHPRDRASYIPELPALLEASGRLEIVHENHSPRLGPLVRFELSDGHTPGLMLATIGSEAHGESVVFCSDLIPGRPWVHVPLTMGYDRYPEHLIDEKELFLKNKLASGTRLYFTHDPDCAMAGLKRDETSGRYSVDEPIASLNAYPLG